MPEDSAATIESAAETTSEVPADAAEGSGGLNPLVALLLVVVVVLVSIQNVWLRRRARREAGSAGDSH